MLTTPLPLTFKGWLELYVSEILSESSNSYVFSGHRKRSFGVRNSESKLGFFCSDEQRILWMGFSSENTSEQACFLYYNGMAMTHLTLNPWFQSSTFIFIVLSTWHWCGTRVILWHISKEFERYIMACFKFSVPVLARIAMQCIQLHVFLGTVASKISAQQKHSQTQCQKLLRECWWVCTSFTKTLF